jgi:hypothetical protein
MCGGKNQFAVIGYQHMEATVPIVLHAHAKLPQDFNFICLTHTKGDQVV